MTLILGILFSMFTAIYMSRTLFDIAERRSLLSLSMSDMVNKFRSSLFGASGYDFMRLGPMALTLSGLLMIAGIGAIVARGGTILDIDFAGGSSVTFRVQEPTSTDAVRAVVAKSLTNSDGGKAEFTVNNVSMETAPPGTVFKVDSAIESVEALKDMIGEGFKADGSLKLVTYEIEITPADNAQSRLSIGQATMLVAMRAQDDAPTTPPAEGDAAPAAETPVAEAAPATPPTEAAPAAEATDPPATATDAAPDTPAAPPAAEQPAEATTPPPARAPEVISRSRVKLGIEGSTADTARINAKSLLEGIDRAAKSANVSIDLLGVELSPQGDQADQWSTESELRFSEWEIGLPIEFGPADEVMASLKQTLGSDPVWISSSSVGSRVAGDMINRALGAVFASLLCIVGYIWFRFQRVFYGLAAVAALVHDVIVTLGAIAVSYWLASFLGFLLVDQFKISLTVVAALLTVIGYSLNDTIVVFDRIRETKGKSPRLTSEMVNTSINSTLSRTLLTSLTTLIVVVLLYFFGGEGIHAFAFSLVVGVTVGTYSSIFVASPILLWLVTKYQPAARAS